MAVKHESNPLWEKFSGAAQDLQQADGDAADALRVMAATVGEAHYGPRGLASAIMKGLYPADKRGGSSHDFRRAGRAMYKLGHADSTDVVELGKRIRTYLRYAKALGWDGGVKSNLWFDAVIDQTAGVTFDGTQAFYDWLEDKIKEGREALKEARSDTDSDSDDGDAEPAAGAGADFATRMASVKAALDKLADLAEAEGDDGSAQQAADMWPDVLAAAGRFFEAVDL